MLIDAALQDDGYIYPSDFSPLNRTYDKRGPSYTEDYSHANPNNVAGFGMELTYPAAKYGDFFGFGSTSFPSSSGFTGRSPTSYSHDILRSFSPLRPFDDSDRSFGDPHRGFEPPSDAGVTSDPYPEVSGPPGWDDDDW